ncbi:DNA internalization-related competence protein ComEC/Rec2 [uncultured Finegoldia sp.]|uniref:DNA internalization-related competence protein ComEC/Rec2 n=1 Tax=uncultured Finegoldia sp. TaxID=328009 RepID=UPI00261BB41F|nr:DNA internalization-related competence protein ComEC/Rec2 [uncultured Finegoldia sp.]
MYKHKLKLCAALIIIFLTIIHLNIINTTYNQIKDNEFMDVNCVVVNKNRSAKKYIVKSLYKKNVKFFLKTKEDYSIGDIINIRAKVNKAYTNGNPYMFNYKFFLLKNNIYGDFYTRTNPVIIGKSNSILLKTRKIVLNYITKKFDSNFTQNTSTILKSIFTGYNFLNDDYYENIKSLGISHIFAISGLHIIIIYTIFNKIFGLFHINRKIISWISIIFIGIYGYVVGLPSSIIRAFIMLLIVELSNQMQIDWYNLNNLFIAAIIILLINPYNIFDAGFLFSFLATFTIIYLYPKLKKKNKNLYNYFLLSSLVYIVLLPVQLRFFNEYTLGFIIGNMFILPIFTIIIELAVFVLIIPNKICYACVFLIDILMSILDYIFKTINIFNIKTYNFMSFSILMIIVYYLLLFTIYNWHYVKTLGLYNKQTLTKMLIMSFTIPFILNIINPITIINFVDVGQGDCCLVRQYFNSFMIDTGGSYKENDKSGIYLVDYLKKIGLCNLDYVFLTHFDEDHSKNIIEINKSYKPIVLSRRGGKEIFINKYHQGNKYLSIDNHDSFKIGNVKIFVINKPVSSEENDKSLVYHLYVNNISILVTGDISGEYERNILNENIKSTILKVSHHGSKSSSDINFLKKVHPKQAVISCGWRNEYGHPHATTIRKLSSLKIPIKRIDLDGNIEVISSENFNSIKSNRSKFSFYHFFVREQNSLLSVIIILVYFRNRGVKNGLFIG